MWSKSHSCHHLVPCWPGFFTLVAYVIFRDYFGEKVALYYLWLGWYTRMLIPAAFIGIVVFLYGIAFFNTSPLMWVHLKPFVKKSTKMNKSVFLIVVRCYSKEVCHSNIIMCPRCDRRCHVWNLSDTCTYAKVSSIVNGFLYSKNKYLRWMLTFGIYKQVSQLFDNEGTVAFAMFMAIWGKILSFGRIFFCI